MKKFEVDHYSYTVKLIYPSGACITKRGLEKGNVDSLLEYNEETKKFVHIIISRFLKEMKDEKYRGKYLY